MLRTDKKSFIEALKRKTIAQIDRRGKALLMRLSSGQYLVVHLMMTGQLVFQGNPDRHTRLRFDFKDGSRLLYNDQRKFGQLRISKNPQELSYFSKLGPEPLGQNFSPEHIFQHTRSSRRPIKNLLLDHTFVAGIGNIYACEILFRSKINPKRLAGRINQGQSEVIYHKTREVLTEAIRYRGSSMRNYRDGQGQEGSFNQRVQVYAKEKEPCCVCHKPLKRIVQAGRSTFYCGNCQV